MQNITLSAVLALANDKSAALDAAARDVSTAAARVILHGDAALYQSTATALESRKGSTAAAILGRLRAAWAGAVEARKAAYPDGRKGRATGEQEEQAAQAAAAIGAAFRAACVADAEERSAKAKAAQAAAKAKREAAAALPVAIVAEVEQIEAAPAPALPADAVAADILSRGIEYAAAVLVALRTAIEAAGQEAAPAPTAEQATAAAEEAAAATAKASRKGRAKAAA